VVRPPGLPCRLTASMPPSSSTSYHGPLLTSEAGLAPASTETETAAVSGTGSGVSNLSSSRTTGLSAYRLGGCLIYSDRELGRIPRVPWLLPTPSSGLFGSLFSSII
jgi:hypothetical protein